MPEIRYMKSVGGNRLAYRLREGSGHGMMFLPGLKSSMDGTKAEYLDCFCMRAGRSYLRMDYSGHGFSSGRFEEGTIGTWYSEVLEVKSHAVGDVPVIMVGSSMGAWLALRIAQTHPEHVAAVIGIASAPDFTRHLVDNLTEQDRSDLESDGQYLLASDPEEDPIAITSALLADGRDHHVMDMRLLLPGPARLLHADDDRDVPVNIAIDLLLHAECDDISLTILKGEGHRMSSARSLRAIMEAIGSVDAALAG